MLPGGRRLHLRGRTRMGEGVVGRPQSSMIYSSSRQWRRPICWWLEAEREGCRGTTAAEGAWEERCRRRSSWPEERGAWCVGNLDLRVGTTLRAREKGNLNLRTGAAPAPHLQAALHRRGEEQRRETRHRRHHQISCGGSCRVLLLQIQSEVGRLSWRGRCSSSSAVAALPYHPTRESRASGIPFGRIER
jgi:hypothetical protein